MPCKTKASTLETKANATKYFLEGSTKTKIDKIGKF